MTEFCTAKYECYAGARQPLSFQPFEKVFGDDEMTDSGYPRTVYEWKRGTSLSSAQKVFEGEKADVSVSGFAYLDRGHKYEMRVRSLTFYTSRYTKLPLSFW